jgi:MoaA/NifB/PqqE/SkfB family radical SAM enzyme
MKNGNIQNKSLSKNDIDLLIKKLPDNTKSIVLTGGEVYLVKDLLFYTLDQINKKFTDIIIGIESNGKYLYENESTISKELKKLEKYGVSFIRFSDDIFHAEGGIDLNKVRKIKDYKENINVNIEYLVQSDALPIGKASNLSEEFQGKRECMNTAKTYNNPYLFIDINGEVYSCAWKCTPSLGNIYKDSFLKIENNLHSGIQKEILVGEIDNIIKRSENYPKYKKIKECQGTCMSCFEYFKDLR